MAEKRTTDKEERKQTHFIPTKWLRHYDVIDGNGQLLGRVEQIIVDMSSGHVAYMLVATEGVARSHDKWVAMPPGVLTWEPENVRFTTSVLSDNLGDAPTVPKPDRDDATLQQLRDADEHARLLSVISGFYSVTPFRLQTQDEELQPAAEPVAEFVPVSHLTYYDVINDAGEDMGQVQEFVLDMAGGQLACVVVAFGGTLGLTDKWIAMPFDILTWQPETHKLKLDAPRTALEDAPGIDKDEWPDRFLGELSDRNEHAAWMERVYGCFDCSPYWTC